MNAKPTELRAKISHPLRDFDLSLDLEPSHGLREALENPNRIDGLFMDRVLIQHSERLFVLSAEESPDESLLLDYGAVELLMTELRNKFHYVVVDLPRTTSACTLQVLQSATDLVLVTDLSLAGMRDTMRITGMLPTTNASCNTTLVVNRVGEHKQGEMPRAEFEKGVSRKLDLLLPFDAKTVAAATNFGQPVASSAKGPVSAGLREITVEYLLPGNQAEVRFPFDHGAETVNLLVEESDGTLVGLVSYRAILRLLAHGTDVAGMTVADIMKPEPVCVPPDMAPLRALELMRQFGIGALPVVSDGQLVGIVTEHDFFNVAGMLLLEQLQG